MFKIPELKKKCLNFIVNPILKKLGFKLWRSCVSGGVKECGIVAGGD